MIDAAIDGKGRIACIEGNHVHIASRADATKCQNHSARTITRGTDIGRWQRKGVNYIGMQEVCEEAIAGGTGRWQAPW